MPLKKGHVRNRAKGIAKARGTRWSDMGETEVAGENQPSGLPSSPPSPPPSGDPIADCPGSQSELQSIESPECLAANLGGLSLDTTLDSEENIVLEDPPVYEEDPLESINPPSLADSEVYEDLPLDEPGSEQPKEDKEKKKNNNQPIPSDEAEAMVEALNKIISTSWHGLGKHQVCSLGRVTLNRLQFMAGTLQLMTSTNMGLMDSSLMAARVFGRGEWAARQVRAWIRVFQEKNELPTNIYGHWNESVIEDEDLSSELQDWLRTKGKYVQASDIIDFFDTPEALPFSHLVEAPPSLRTAQRWMHRMGYTWKTERRGQFADGHERDDVVEYRMKYYVPEWLKLEKRMRSWDAEGNEIPPKLNKGERTVVVWFHDESTFYAHDRRLTRWIHENEKAAIHKKGEGVSLMVADFVSADYGWLRLGSDPPNHNCDKVDSTVEVENFTDAQVIFRAGINRDGWFGTADVVKQLSRAMSIVKRRYPDEDHVFVFDNATIHTKLPETTPNVNKMTLGPSQKVKGEQIGPSGEKVKVDYTPANLPDGTVQQFYHPLDHPIPKLRGAFKGMAQILEERGVIGARRLKLHCPSTNSQKGPGCLPGATECCARRTMMNQPDFLLQKSILQLQAEAEGFSVLYLPKYHCELNPIEQCWGAAKRVYRDSPSSSTEADLKQNMLAALDSVKLESIRRFAARSRRFVHAYHKGLSGSEAAWANKSYHSHRVIPEAILKAMDEPSN